ncbi:MAG: amidohydrolase [Cyclobacteriaceae bacterium]
MKTTHTSTALFLFIGFLFFSCQREKASLIIKGGNIYTVEENLPLVEAIAIKDNRIIFTGSEEEVKAYSSSQTKIINLEGKTLTPGLIEGHGHFMGLGYNELNIDLIETKSYAEIIRKIKVAVENASPGQWIIGRGWHQNKWIENPEKTVDGFPLHEELSAISNENPVFLYHASGHAGLANAKAMEIAGMLPLNPENRNGDIIEGGEITRDITGNPTGIFNERAMSLITKYIPESTPEMDRKAFELAVNACLRNGITSFHDAGIGRSTLELYRQMKAEGKMNVRLYAMLSGGDRELLEEWYEKGPEIDPRHLLTIRSIKLNCDGALGSRGAWLLEEYADRPGHFGHETQPMEMVYETAKMGLKHDFQVCSHAIGDRANREVLDRYEKAFMEFKGNTKDHRFRIEHAQHLHPDDISRFAKLNVIPAMQAIHMSSDRPWAINRLGARRIKEGAYMWQALLQSGVRIVNGTDVPVEPLNPLACFYASVTRKTLNGTPNEGYEPEQKMTRKQALKAYTLDAAYGAFEENFKGSIKNGKLADLVVFDQDIMTIPEEEILRTNIVMTLFDGKVVFKK